MVHCEVAMAGSDWQAEMAEALKRVTGPGVSPMETLKALPGLDFLQRIVDGRLPRPPICDTLNFQLLEVERGRAVFQGTPKPEHYNPLGSIHGGWPPTPLRFCLVWAGRNAPRAVQRYATV